MKKEKANKSTISTWKALKKMRGNWGQVNSVTKIISNKKKNYDYDNDYYNIDDCCYDLEHDPYEEDDYIYINNEYEPGRVYYSEMEANP